MRGTFLGLEAFSLRSTRSRALTLSRGAMNGLLAVVLEDHIRTHLVDAEPHDDEHGSGTEQLIEVVHSYFK